MVRINVGQFSFLKMSCNPKLKFYCVDRFNYVHCWKVTFFLAVTLEQKEMAFRSFKWKHWKCFQLFMFFFFVLQAINTWILGTFMWQITATWICDVWWLSFLEMSLLKHCWNVVAWEPWFMTFFCFLIWKTLWTMPHNGVMECHGTSAIIRIQCYNY